MSLILFFLLITIMITDAEERLWLVKDNQEYNQQFKQEALISRNEEFIKVTDFYNKIIGRYGKRYHSKNIQAMHPRQRAKWVKRCYEYSKKLDLPLMAVLSIALFESGFNPKADGPFNEAGMFQLRPSAVRQADSFRKKIKSKKLREELAFRDNNRNDLEDPLNALKIACLLLYGYRIEFGSNPVWYISAYHWGGHLMGKFYYAKALPPENFVFNKGTLREDVREPFSYYFVWAHMDNAFSSFRQYITIPLDYIEAYRKQAGEHEIAFIDHYKFVRKLKTSIKDLEKVRSEFEEDRKKELKRVENLLVKAENDYIQMKGWIKKGNFRSLNEVWMAEKSIYKNLLKNIVQERLDFKSRLALYVSVAMLAIMAFFSLIGLYIFCRWLYRKVFRRKDSMFYRQ